MSGMSNWDYLAKRLIWDVLPALSGRVLDFGSGSGEIASVCPSFRRSRSSTT